MTFCFESQHPNHYTTRPSQKPAGSSRKLQITLGVSQISCITYVIVQRVQLMCQRQVVIIRGKVCHHEATSISRAAHGRVASMVAVTCRHMRMLNTQVVDAASNCQAVSLGSMT